MSRQTGYAVGEFRDGEAEIARLRAQARVAVAAEQGHLADLGLPAQGRFLEVGCGPGFVTEALRELRPGLTVVGLDLDPALLGVAKDLFPAVRGDAARLPFADRTFDFVYARLVARHLPDPRSALSEMGRVLRPGGRLVVADTDDDAILVHPEPEGYRVVRQARHRTHARRGADAFVGRKLPVLLREAGFEEVGVRTLVIDSEATGPEAFARIVLDPLTQAIDADLLPAERAADAGRAFEAWGRRELVFGMTVGILVGGSRPRDSTRT